MTAAVRAAEFRQNGWWPDRTLIDLLRDATRAHPDKPAIIATRSFSRDRLNISYAELSERVDRFAIALLELGVRPQQIVAVQLPNWWQYTAIALACARIGAIIAPIPPDYRRRELEFILAQTNAPLYIGPTSWVGFSYRDMLREIAPVLPSLRHRVLFEAGEDLANGEADFDVLFSGPSSESALLSSGLRSIVPKPDDLFLVMYTSGTTGEPKGVMHSHNTLHAITRALVDTVALGGDDVITTPSSLTGFIGFTYNFLVPLFVGGTAAFADVGDPDGLLKTVEECGITFMYAIPTFILSLNAAQQRLHRKTKALRCFVTGSAPVPPHLIQATSEAFGIRLHTLWGMTETGGVTFTRPDDPPEWPASSDGRPVPWMELKIVPALGQDGESFSDGTGRLLVRGANQCLGYFRRESLYSTLVDSEGWFDTGDLARPDQRGGIKIVGRIKDIIFRHGQKIPAVEVESALYSHPKVREVALIPDPDERIGERVCAVVVPKEDAPTLGDLREHLRGLGMAAQYWPDRLEIVTELPKTSSGKIQKYLLREQLEKRPATTQ